MYLVLCTFVFCFVSQALKALDAARTALAACTEDLSVLDSRRTQVSQPTVSHRAERRLLFVAIRAVGLYDVGKIR